MTREKKRWTDEEKEYLCESWGTVSIPSIAKHLNRSVKAVVAKARILNLGAFLDSGSYITVHQLFKAIGIASGESYKQVSWIEKRRFPVKTKKVLHERFQVVLIDDFWEWAYQNQELIDFSKMERNILGPEPEWVENARKSDFMKNEVTVKIPWTKTDDKLLLDLLKSYKYSTSEIALKLRRSEGAVIRRISTLGIKYRPLRNNPNTFWTEEEMNVLFSLIDGGFSYVCIGLQIPRHSTKAIRGVVYREYGTENLDKVRSIRAENRELTVRKEISQ